MIIWKHSFLLRVHRQLKPWVPGKKTLIEILKAHKVHFCVFYCWKHSPSGLQPCTWPLQLLSVWVACREILASLARSMFFSLERETFSGHYAEEIQGLLPMSNFRIMSSFSEISFSSTLLIINYYILQQQYPSKLALKWSLHRLCTVLFSWLTLTGLSLCQPFKLTIC